MILYFLIAIITILIITAIGLIAYISYNFKRLNESRHRSEKIIKLEIIQALNSTNDPVMVSASKYLFDRIDK